MNPNYTIPSTMTAVLVNEVSRLLYSKQLPVAMPSDGEVLIKVSAAPINPSDLVRLRNMTTDEIENHIPGIEGSGEVVAAGKGIFPRFLLGKRVACSAVHPTSGTWAEYCVTKATACFPLGKSITDEQGSMMLVNPLTALAFSEIIKLNKHKAIISTAGAGALGRMIEYLCDKNNIKVVNIVRSKEQNVYLNQSGSKYVLNSSEEDFPERLSTLAKELNVTLALEAVGGKLTEHLVRSIAFKGTVIIYGNLSKENPEFDSRTLTLGNKNIQGFYLTNWIHDKKLVHTIKSLFKVKRLLKNGVQVTIQNRFSLERSQEAIETYQTNMTSGKVLLIPGLQT